MTKKDLAKNLRQVNKAIDDSMIGVLAVDTYNIIRALEDRLTYTTTALLLLLEGKLDENSNN